MELSGYTHTCAACDAKLKIHERYVGRTLHCPTCGTEFLADPSLADVDDILEDLVPDDRRPIPWRALAIALVVLAAIAWWIGQVHEGGWFADWFKPTRGPSQFAVLEIEGETQVPAAMDRETVVFIVGALEDPDPGTLAALRVQGRIIDIAAGTRIKIIEWIRRDKIARVRVLTGPWTGRVVWVGTMTVR